MSDSLSRIGQKAVITEEGLAEGWLAPFGGPMKGDLDLDGEAFTAATDFALDYYPSIPILYAHGRDPEVGAAKVGEITVKEIRDKGLWVQGQLDRQSAYYGALRDLAEKGDLYWSSGAISHLVHKDTKSGAIKSWPVAEATLTLTPANPDAAATVKDAEPEQVTVTPAGYSVTFTYPTKEGRRHNAADKARIDQIHQLLSELGAEPEPDPEPAGKEADVPPANVLTITVGNDVEPPTDADLVTVKETLAAFARAEARRLLG